MGVLHCANADVTYHDIKNLANEVIPFRNTLRRFLLIHSLYDSDEYFNYKRQSIETLKSELTLGFKDSITVFILQLRLFWLYVYIMLDGMYVTKSISTVIYPNLDLWTANKLQLQLHNEITQNHSED